VALGGRQSFHCELNPPAQFVQRRPLLADLNALDARDPMRHLVSAIDGICDRARLEHQGDCDRNGRGSELGV
jgi:hypothetical protein